MLRNHQAEMSVPPGDIIPHPFDNLPPSVITIPLLTNPNSRDIEVLLSLGSSAAYCLVDSGAQISLLNAKIADSIDPDKSLRRALDTPLVLRFISKHTPAGQITHVLTVPVQVEDIRFNWTFYIMPSSYNDVLLGLDFIKASGLTWDWVDDNRGGKEMKVFMRFSRRNAVQEHVTTVRCINPEVIRPRSCKAVVVKSNYRITAQAAFIEPFQAFLLRRHVLIPRSVIDIEDGKAVLFVFNPNGYSVSLRSNSELAVLTTLQDDSVSVNINDIDASAVVRSTQPEGNSTIDPDIATIKLPEHLSPQEQHDLQVLLSRYRGAFAFKSSELGKCNVTKHVIDLIDPTPIRCRPHRHSQVEREEINKC